MGQESGFFDFYTRFFSTKVHSMEEFLGGRMEWV